MTDLIAFGPFPHIFSAKKRSYKSIEMPVRYVMVFVCNYRDLIFIVRNSGQFKWTQYLNAVPIGANFWYIWNMLELQCNGLLACWLYMYICKGVIRTRNIRKNMRYFGNLEFTRSYTECWRWKWEKNRTFSKMFPSSHITKCDGHGH